MSGLFDSAFGFTNDLLTGSMRILFFERFSAYKPQEGISGFFVYKNAFASHTALAVLCAAFLLHQELWKELHVRQSALKSVALALLKSRAMGLWYLLALAFLLGAVFAADSRLVSISTILMLPLFVFLAANSPKVGFRTFLFATSALVFAMLLNPTLMGRFLTLNHGFSVRADVYDFAVSAILERPFAGYGLGSFRWIYWKNQPESEIFAFREAHSTILELLVSLGAPAAAALGLCVLLLAARIAFGWRSGGSCRRWSAFGLTLLTFILVQAAFDFSLQLPAVSYTAAALLGAAFVRVRLSSGDTDSNRARSQSEYSSRFTTSSKAIAPAPITSKDNRENSSPQKNV
jgi:O-antigen ligase